VDVDRKSPVSGLSHTLATSINPEIPVLSARDLKVTFLKERGLFIKKKFLIKALDGVSLDVYRSEFVTVVGETGSGKTTLARCIMGLETPQDGTLKFEGVDVTRLRGKEILNHLRRVQIVYQDPYESLNPAQDVFKIVSTPIRRLLREKNEVRIREKVTSVLADVGLEGTEVMHRFPHQLSGGQRQRVNIARALAPEPELLIADEPITMLDAEQRLNILMLLRSLREKRKLTILMITHDLASARLTSDRIVVMYLGKIVESGQTKDVVSLPHHPYVELILASAPRAQSKGTPSNPSISSYDEIPPMDENMYPQSGCVFAPRCRYSEKLCRDVEPKLEEVSFNRRVACHFALNTARAKILPPPT
jgi:peptide/nickel transport system ATP-binding protein